VGDLQELTDKAHVFVGVTFTDDNGTAATPGAGTYTITAELVTNPGVFQAIQNAASVDATAALQTYNFAGPVRRIKVAPSSITTATKYNVKVTAFAN
jgi:hypothetical protein